MSNVVCMREYRISQVKRGDEVSADTSHYFHSSSRPGLRPRSLSVRLKLPRLSFSGHERRDMFHYDLVISSLHP